VRRRRGQAALEYLVTYGWGILAILVVVGALAYFGLFDPARYLPDRCEFGAQLECVDYQIATTTTAPGAGASHGYVRLQLRNNLGDGVNITRVWAGTSSATLWYGSSVASLTAWPAQGRRVAQGNVSEVIQVQLPLNYPVIAFEGERQEIALTVEFRRDALGAPLHNVSGILFATAVR
jgi:hypothetical protein